MLLEPFVAYPMRTETRPLILDMDIGEAFWKAKAIVYPGQKTGGLQRPQVIISHKKGSWPKSKGVARVIAKAKDEETVWHRNGNSFDCRRENLECLSHSEYHLRLYSAGNDRLMALLPKAETEG